MPHRKINHKDLKRKKTFRSRSSSPVVKVSGVTLKIEERKDEDSYQIDESENKRPFFSRDSNADRATQETRNMKKNSLLSILLHVEDTVERMVVTFTVGQS